MLGTRTKKTEEEEEMSKEKLTFGELCEAIARGKKIQRYSGNSWEDIMLLPTHSVGDLWCIGYNLRIKPAPVKRYNWICKNPVGYWMLGNHKQKYTREEAEFIVKETFPGVELVEPYLPSEVYE
jgi:hypothetical protein